MPDSRVHAGYGHAFFLTFSCYKRRRILDEDPLKTIVLEIMASQLGKRNGKCQGVVIMPDHIHAMVWFPEVGELSTFMKQCKQTSSVRIKRNLKENRSAYLHKVSLDDPVWQAGYYSFNIYSDRKMREKLEYMHANPVRAGLVARPAEWRFSSAAFYASGVDVGIAIEQPG
jgi:putative transposase